MRRGIPRQQTDALLLVKKNHVGYGVYAGRAIEKGVSICTMRGKTNGAYVLYLKGNAFRRAIVDPLQVGANEYVDLAEPFIYINHSCDPNAALRGKNELFAFRTISPGEEITFDYSTTVDETFLCRCGSKKCRKFIPVDFFGLPRRLQAYYVRHKAVPTHIEQKYKKQQA